MMKPIMKLAFVILLIAGNILRFQPAATDTSLVPTDEEIVVSAIATTDSQTLLPESSTSAVPTLSERPANSFGRIPETTTQQSEQPVSPVEDSQIQQSTVPTPDCTSVPSSPIPSESFQTPMASDAEESHVHFEPEPAVEFTPIQVIATEPEPVEHIHNWQSTSYPETGHYGEYYSCACGYILASPGDYDAHVATYAGTAEMFTVHGHWGTSSQWVVDVPAYTEWHCTGCGTVSSSQP